MPRGECRRLGAVGPSCVVGWGSPGCGVCTTRSPHIRTTAVAGTCDKQTVVRDDRLQPAAAAAQREIPSAGSISVDDQVGAALARATAGVSARLARSPLWGTALLALLYYGSAKVGYAFGFSGPIASIVWLPVGVGAAFLTIGGLSYWPGALIGDLIANDYSSLPVWGAVGQTVGNLIEVVVIALLVHRIMRQHSPSPRSAASWGSSRRSAPVPLSAPWWGRCHSRPQSGLPIGHVPCLLDLVAGRTPAALLVLPLALAWSPGLRSASDSTDVRGGRDRRARRVAELDRGAQESARPTSSSPCSRWWRSASARGSDSAVFVSVAFVVWGETDRHGHFGIHGLSTSVFGDAVVHRRRRHVSLAWTALVAERENAEQGMRKSAQRAFAATERSAGGWSAIFTMGLDSVCWHSPSVSACRCATRPTRRSSSSWSRARSSSIRRSTSFETSGTGCRPSVLSELGLAERDPHPGRAVDDPGRAGGAARRAGSRRTSRPRPAPADQGDRRCAEHSRASSIRRERRLPPAGLTVVVEDDGIQAVRPRSVGGGLRGIRSGWSCSSGTSPW